MEHPEQDTVFVPFLAEMQRRSGQNGCNQAGPGVGWDEARNSALVRDRGWVFACLFDFGDSEPDWDDVRKRLVDLRVFDLPDPRTLTPEGAFVLDGISIEVEILRAAHFRSYMYGNPGSQPWPEAELAQKIMDVVWSLTK